MRMTLLVALALAGCGGPDDQLSDEQGAADQNQAIEAPVAIDRPAAPAPVTASPAITYRAVGTEPSWALTISGATMNYQGDYGSVTISEATPAGFRPLPGRYAGARLKLLIAPGPCSDGMSDLAYRHTVRLMADGKTVNGCGGATIAPAELAGSNWTVIAINGRATPGGSLFFVDFQERRAPAPPGLIAQFGCNRLAGHWFENGDHVWIDDLDEPEKTCREPARTFEAGALRVMKSNMRIERTSGEVMRLVSEAGSIDLKRAM